MMLIDTHCHLHHARFTAEEPALSPEQYLANAHSAGVGQVISIACRRSEWQGALAFAEKYPAQVGVVCGIHPHDTGTEGGLTMADIEGLATGATQAALGAAPTPHGAPLAPPSRRLVGVGETGLDYHYNHSPKDIQIKAFHEHLEVASQCNLPVVIHTRDAEADTIHILKQYPNQPFVLHCFSGTQWLAEEALALGGYLSFSGILTFKKSSELKEIATSTPRDKVLLETDAPYLAPEPVRSFRNESKYITHTAACLANLWQTSQPQVAKITSTNAKHLFSRL